MQRQQQLLHKCCQGLWQRPGLAPATGYRAFKNKCDIRHIKEVICCCAVACVTDTVTTNNIHDALPLAGKSTVHSKALPPKSAHTCCLQWAHCCCSQMVSSLATDPNSFPPLTVTCDRKQVETRSPSKRAGTSTLQRDSWTLVIHCSHNCFIQHMKVCTQFTSPWLGSASKMRLPAGQRPSILTCLLSSSSSHQVLSPSNLSLVQKIFASPFHQVPL